MTISPAQTIICDNVLKMTMSHVGSSDYDYIHDYFYDYKPLEGKATQFILRLLAWYFHLRVIYNAGVYEKSVK